MMPSENDAPWVFLLLRSRRGDIGPRSNAGDGAKEEDARDDAKDDAKERAGATRKSHDKERGNDRERFAS